ncbi:MAG TPA: MTH938/NDUFAF3 family protein, partial [Gammaproteobacteria bacterium]|nr:MTH938/NDUFAF3 family protein [Gammaproteobacteria bacterium]
AVDTPARLRVEDLEPAITMRPEVLLLGTGARLVLPIVNLMQLLGERGIGLEIMDTPAACRTYNVLAHEHRRVVAALFEPGD